uniref:ryncolin-1-like n=1 Tax=Styela clava TaxID=7725 RepID=UPI00193A8CF7|nr:ryncolin-1-like [Styela clava]
MSLYNIYIVLVLLLYSRSVVGQEDIRLCTKMYEYCKLQQTSGGQSEPCADQISEPGRVGKTGPRGMPGQKGEPGVVDYNRVNAKISEDISEVEMRLNEKYNKMEEALQRDRYYPDSCRGLHKLNSLSWNETGGVFEIYPTPVSEKIEVYCDLVTDGGGWIVFQRRMDGSEDFYRGWNDYVNGFGNTIGEFWLGLENIYQTLKSKTYELRVDMEDWEGNKAYAKYGAFSIGDSSTNYRLTVGQYSGNAGDSLGHSQHQGRPFTTKDSDHDTASDENCAVKYKGAFWYGACHATNLNGLYIEGGKAQHAISVVWYHWKGHDYSLKFVEMKMRQKQ